MTRWRSAKRPPDHCWDVLVYLAADDLTLVGYHEGGSHWTVYDHGLTESVTHWQPLPAPPRVRKERKR